MNIITNGNIIIVINNNIDDIGDSLKSPFSLTPPLTEQQQQQQLHGGGGGRKKGDGIPDQQQHKRWINNNKLCNNYLST